MSFRCITPSSMVIKPPSNEVERFGALRRLSVLDSERDDKFDAFTRIAMRLCDASISTISLVDENRVYNLSTSGLDGVQGISAPREETYCNYTILDKKPFLINGTMHGDQLSKHPLVVQFGIQFYLGVPLITKEGHSIGTLCVMDFRQKEENEINEEDIDGVISLSKLLVSELETRAAIINTNARQQLLQFDMGVLQSDKSKLFAAINAFKEGYVAWDNQLKVVLVNESFTRIFGYSQEEADNLCGIEFLFSDRTDPEKREKLMNDFKLKQGVNAELICRRKNGENFVCLVVIRPIFDLKGELSNYFGFISDITSIKTAEKNLGR
eukprot:TRINITY_DN4118_c0_g1_i2.p1 TRINITY_DN4118_c0_g1~~TRINITY_DN4118_c0_g1_i2.p1  ORF type:complete len:325 (-),score=87.94 TRINITY_DN4118_c0_g1_i2:108-1082(-)